MSDNKSCPSHSPEERINSKMCIFIVLLRLNFAKSFRTDDLHWKKRLVVRKIVNWNSTLFAVCMCTCVKYAQSESCKHLLEAWNSLPLFYLSQRLLSVLSTFVLHLLLTLHIYLYNYFVHITNTVSSFDWIIVLTENFILAFKWLPIFLDFSRDDTKHNCLKRTRTS